jgi:hypothetical protein
MSSKQSRYFTRFENSSKLKSDDIIRTLPFGNGAGSYLRVTSGLRKKTQTYFNEELTYERGFCKDFVETIICLFCEHTNTNAATAATTTVMRD